MSETQLAFVFPGQGSQKVGMLAELASSSDVVQQTFAEASEVLGYDLWNLSQEGPQERLNQTETTQPLLLSSSVAIWRAWQAQGGATPSLLTGHSLGEWSALVCAGIVDFKDAVSLVRLRGRYMQEAVPAGEGAMAAIIGLKDDAIKAACEQAAQGEVVAAVNFNAPGQVVIAGAAAAVDRAIVACKEAGAKRAMPLPVSAPFHTDMMRPAADRLLESIRETTFNVPSIPVIHNVTAATESNPDTIKELMYQQIYTPVPWVDCTRALAAAGVANVVECGPGKVLAGLCKRIEKGIKYHGTESPVELSAAIEACKA